MKIAVVLHDLGKQSSFDAFKVYIHELKRRGHDVRFMCEEELWFSRASIFVKSFKPDVVWTWNGKFDWYKGFFWCLKQEGYRILVTEFAWLPQLGNYFITDFDDAFHNCRHTIPDDYPINLDAIQALKSKYGIEENRKNYILIPLQLEGDTSILHRSPVISNMKDLCLLAKQLFPDKELIIKRHPRLPQFTLDGFTIYEGPESTLQLAVNAEYVVSVNSTVTIETLLWHNRIICFGRNPAHQCFSLSGCSDEKRFRTLSWLMDRQYRTDVVSDKVINYIETGAWT